MRDLVVLYQDSSMLVVDKPAGVHTAPLASGESGTMLDAVIEAFPEVARLPGVKAVEPGLLHRLDRETSGLVVIARTATAFHALREIFAAGKTRKGYLAVCAGKVGAPAALRIESRFTPYGPGRHMVRVVPLEGKGTGRTYVTEADVASGREGSALVHARITRGFRHQVRAHLAARGYPIYGDPLYGIEVPPGRPPRMYLHAERIEMPHPETGTPLVIVSPVPPEMAAFY